jgi:hypothetical protein
LISSNQQQFCYIRSSIEPPTDGATDIACCSTNGNSCFREFDPQLLGRLFYLATQNVSGVGIASGEAIEL